MSSGHQDADTLRDKSILDADGREKLVPIFVEGVSVAKEKVVTGRVKVTTITNNRDKLIDILLMRERVKIERLPVDRPIATIPDIRDDGDTTIIPGVEKMIVVERRLVLKEEIRLRRVRSSEKVRRIVVGRGARLSRRKAIHQEGIDGL